MNKIINLIFAALLLGFCTKSQAGETQSAEAKQTVENFTLSDYNGQKYSLSDYKDAKATVLIFVSTRCPVSNAYNERMEKLYEDFKDQGIVFLGLNANVKEDLAEIKQHAREHSLNFPILKDENNVIADKLEASVTPEAYVLTPAREIVYHGRIDDSRDLSNVKSEDLRKALNEVLAGKAVSISRTRAFGCTIKRIDT